MPPFRRCSRRGCRCCACGLCRTCLCPGPARRRRGRTITGGCRGRFRSLSRRPATYRIASIEVNAQAQRQRRRGAGLADVREHRQRADGSVLHVPAAVRRRDRPADAAGRRQGVRRQAAVARKRPASGTRRSSARTATRPCWNGSAPACSRRACSRFPPGAKRTVTLRYSQLCRKTHGLTDFLFPLSTAKYTAGELDKLSIRVAIESTRRHQERVLADAHRRASSGPTTSTPSSSSKRRRRFPARTFACSSTADDGDVARERRELSAREATRTATSCCWPAPQIKQPDAKTASQDGRVRRRSLRQHERREDGAGPARPPSSCSTTCARATCSTSWPTTARSKRSGPSWRSSTTKRARPRPASSTACTPAAARTSTAPSTRALGMLQDDKRPDLRALPHRRPAHGRRNGRSGDRRATPRKPTTCGPACSPSASATTSTAGCSTSSPATNHGQSEYVRPNEDIEASVSSLYRHIGAPVMTDVTLTVDVEGANESPTAPTTSRVYPKRRVRPVRRRPGRARRPLPHAAAPPR